MAYQAKEAKVLDQQLKVQELLVRFNDDKQLFSVSGNDVIVDIGEALADVPMVILHDNSAASPSIVSVKAADIAISGDTATITLAAPFTTDDVLLIKYIVS